MDVVDADLGTCRDGRLWEDLTAGHVDPSSVIVLETSPTTCGRSP